MTEFIVFMTFVLLCVSAVIVPISIFGIKKTIKVQKNIAENKRIKELMRKTHLRASRLSDELIEKRIRKYRDIVGIEDHNKDFDTVLCFYEVELEKRVSDRKKAELKNLRQNFNFDSIRISHPPYRPMGQGGNLAQQNTVDDRLRDSQNTIGTLGNIEEIEQALNEVDRSLKEVCRRAQQSISPIDWNNFDRAFENFDRAFENFDRAFEMLDDEQSGGSSSSASSESSESSESEDD